MKALIIAVLAMLASGCTDAEKSAWGAMGDEAEVTCYSGGKLIYEGTSTGKVKVVESGFTFRSKQTGKYVRTNADCTITTGG